jgi:branched-chain amino acid transport system permease protein
MRRAVLAGVLGAGVLIVPVIADEYWTSLLVETLIFGLLALSVDLLVGHTGITPLGHAAFFAASAYTAAIAMARYEVHAMTAAGMGVLAAALLAVLFGFAVRTSGVYFILLTLALGEIVWGIAVRWSYTGGDNGVVLPTLPTVAGIEVFALSTYAYVVLFVTALCVLGYAMLTRSVFGLTLRGIRDSESRMRSLGYRVASHKFVAFVLSAILAGTAGALYIFWNKFVSPPTASLHRSADAALMAILGGSGTLFGPFIGAAVITLARNQVSGVIDRWLTLLGIVFVVTALYAPNGILGLWRQFLPVRRGAARKPLVASRVEGE